jgi:chromosome segregation ATPase
MKKYISHIFFVISLSFLLTGCTGLSKKINEIQKTQEKLLAIVERKIQYHEQKLSNLQSICHDIENIRGQIEELFQKIANMDVNYSKLQAALNSLDGKIETRNSSFEDVLSETKKHVSDLEARVSIIQEIENDLQNTITTLQSKLYNIKTETKQYNTDYNEFGYSNQWLRGAFGEIGQKAKPENKKEDNSKITDRPKSTIN